MSIFQTIGICLVVSCLIPGLSMDCHAQSYDQINWSSQEVQSEPFGETKKPPVVTSVRLQPGGSLVAVVGDDHIVSLYDRDSGGFIRQLSEHNDWVQAARFSPDGSRLATAGNDRRLIVWDIANLDRPREIARHPAAIYDVAFSPDGEWVATAGFENRVRIYSVTTGQLINELTASCNDLRTVAFSPAGDLLATGGRNGAIELFDLTTGLAAGSRLVHARRVRSLVFIDSNRIASCGDDRQVQIVNLDNPRDIQTLPQQGGKLFALCVLPNGLLATGGSANTIHIWNPDTLELVGKLTGHVGTITCLDARENTLVSSSYDTRIRFWTTEKIAREPGRPAIRR